MGRLVDRQMGNLPFFPTCVTHTFWPLVIATALYWEVVGVKVSITRASWLAGISGLLLSLLRWLMLSSAVVVLVVSGMVGGLSPGVEEEEVVGGTAAAAALALRSDEESRRRGGTILSASARGEGDRRGRDGYDDDDGVVAGVVVVVSIGGVSTVASVGAAEQANIEGVVGIIVGVISARSTGVYVRIGTMVIGSMFVSCMERPGSNRHGGGGREC